MSNDADPMPQIRILSRSKELVFPAFARKIELSEELDTLVREARQARDRRTRKRLSSDIARQRVALRRAIQDVERLKRLLKKAESELLHAQEAADLETIPVELHPQARVIREERSQAWGRTRIDLSVEMGLRELIDRVTCAEIGLQRAKESRNPAAVACATTERNTAVAELRALQEELEIRASVVWDRHTTRLDALRRP